MADRYRDDAGVYYNKLGITDAAELRAVEYQLTRQRGAELQSGAVSLGIEDFGLDRLQAIHKHLMQDVYPWAGMLRETSLSKRAENGNVSIFEDPTAIRSKWTSLAEQTNAFATAKDLTDEQKRAQLVGIYAQANALHPFPEGNGRTLQTYMRQLANEQGLDLDFRRTTPREWNLASALSGTHGPLFENHYVIRQPVELEPIRKVFDAITRPARAMAFELEPEGQATAKFPELRAAFTALRAIEARALAGSEHGDVGGYMQQIRQAFVKRLDEGTSLDQVRTAPEAERDRGR